MAAAEKQPERRAVWVHDEEISENAEGKLSHFPAEHLLRLHYESVIINFLWL